MAPIRTDGGTFEPLLSLGLDVCQVVGWDRTVWTSELARATREAADRSGVRMTSFWAGWPGPAVWDFVEGPSTLGIVPPAYRDLRVNALKEAAVFASDLGVPAVITHLGFLPENPGDPELEAITGTVRVLARFMNDRGLEFWFETGQETPVALRRLIEQVGEPNLGINLDPANLILYGKANPVDSLLVFGGWVRNVHAKDGFYPTDPMRLGREVPVGDGLVGFPRLVDALESAGFEGDYIIEREITGDQQQRDIRRAIAYLSGEELP